MIVIIKSNNKKKKKKKKKEHLRPLHHSISAFPLEKVTLSQLLYW
jgi:hypothetical protein